MGGVEFLDLLLVDVGVFEVGVGLCDKDVLGFECFSDEVVVLIERNYFVGFVVGLEVGGEFVDFFVLVVDVGVEFVDGFY